MKGSRGICPQLVVQLEREGTVGNTVWVAKGENKRGITGALDV